MPLSRSRMINLDLKMIPVPHFSFLVGIRVAPKQLKRSA